MLSQHDVDNIEAIVGGYGDWFTAQLIRLIGKADGYHKERIRLGFPAEVALWEKWFWKRPEYDAAFEREWEAQQKRDMERFAQESG